MFFVLQRCRWFCYKKNIFNAKRIRKKYIKQALGLTDHTTQPDIYSHTFSHDSSTEPECVTLCYTESSDSGLREKVTETKTIV